MSKIKETMEILRKKNSFDGTEYNYTLVALKHNGKTGFFGSAGGVLDAKNMYGYVINFTERGLDFFPVDKMNYAYLDLPKQSTPWSDIKAMQISVMGMGLQKNLALQTTWGEVTNFVCGKRQPGYPEQGANVEKIKELILSKFGKLKIKQ